ncbi:polysaccharide lyase 8 family protein [Streptomyces angustmyceticus]|uniref:Lyase n=1 Tax=Streptomyces angustmyceticus TaxID=285578 RepID=A0A5J4LKI7_9ACTN|nr:polysaccharide lyase 8 family protein [Streptomyces angustmyceticus]UAL66934.1 polysaccharide lyase 8 family protein [Streptomyces angustmyceticus]GES32060.1 lyase [Streptomyces angustmyceticus]
MPPFPATSVWSRRGFLATATASALGLTARPASALPPGDVFTALRGRWCELTLGSGFDPAAPPYAAALKETGDLAGAFRAGMRPAAGSLWPDCRYDPPAGITRSYGRLATMAQACAQPGTGRTGDPGLAEAVRTGLDHLEATVFHTATTRYGNWWEWQIGSPRLLLDTLAILDDRLPGGLDDGLRERCLAAVDHFVPDTMLGDYAGTSTGANRVDLCRVVALRGILGRAPAKIALARDALSPVFPHVTHGDGLYADGSFVQHTWVAYSGTYGYVLLDGLGRLFTLLGGSPWQVTDPARQTVLDSVEHAYAPLLHNGLMMDSVNGRAVSRGYLRGDERHILRSDHYHGHALIAAIAVLARAASTAERDRWHAMIKGWAARDRTLPVLTDRQYTVADLARLRAIADGPAATAPEPVGHRLFPAMDRAVHRRPGWAAGLAMASDRITYYENGNGENPRGWHTGAGMVYWWGADFGGDQYTDAFWPTVDPYRLPGTTVSTKRLADNEGGGWGEPKPAARWVGGTTDGEYAALGQDLRGLASTLTARKSWFALDDCLVCLGAGITARDGVPAETVVDNRRLGERDTAALTVDGVRMPGTLGVTTTFRRAHWVHLAGHGGYVFPGGAPLTVRREARTGSWHDINTTSTTEPFTRRYVTLWHDHGTDPVDARYCYLLMPGAGPRTLAARAADRRRPAVLANDAGCQAVAVDPLGVTAANFWRAGSAGPLTSSGPVSVLVREHRGRRRPTVRLCLAAPERTGEPLEITWSRPVRTVLAHDPAIEVLATGRALRLRLTPGTDCATHTCTVRPG